MDNGSQNCLIKTFASSKTILYNYIELYTNILHGQVSRRLIN